MDILNSNAENIIKRNIGLIGKEIEFKRPIVNKYGETTDRFEITAVQKCIYHTESINLNSEQTDAGKTASTKKELLLTVHNDEIKIGDYCNVGSVFYRIYAISDYNNSEKFIDISLEVVSDELNGRLRKNV